jgi:hypothetical protein
VNIFVPFLHKSELQVRASEFLAEHHPTLELPIPIDRIVEFELDLDVVPVHDLLAIHGINGYLSGDRTTIFVDRWHFDNVPNRYRFTLAHEAGHLVLHRDLFPTFDSDDEWLQFHRDVPEAAVGMAEWQADQFAGLVLVPPNRLSEVTPPHFREVARRIREEGQAIDLTCDPVWSVIANRVAKPFEVSAQTAEICLKRDGLWGKDLSG